MISCIIAVLIIVIGVFIAMFNLKTISVEILKNPSIVEAYGEDVGQQIIDSGEFAYGSNVMFSSYKANEEKIEKAFPFVKIEKLVRKFPDKMTIYVSGRMPEAIVEDSGNPNRWYVVDIDFKVLAVLTNASELQNDLYKNLPKVSGAEFSNLNAADFVDNKMGATVIRKILDGIYGEAQSPSSVMSGITMDLSKKECVITLRAGDIDGATISINGFDYLTEKVFCAYHLYKTRYINDDIKYPNKSDLDLIVGNDFVPVINEKVVEHDRRNDDE